MKLRASGVANWAAIATAPWLTGSPESTITTMFPATSSPSARSVPVPSSRSPIQIYYRRQLGCFTGGGTEDLKESGGGRAAAAGAGGGRRAAQVRPLDRPRLDPSRRWRADPGNRSDHRGGLVHGSERDPRGRG